MQTSPSEFFSKYAREFSESDSHAHGSDLARLVKLLSPRTDEVVLDVATGTAFTAMALSEKVKEVVATDITQEMLYEAERLARERGIKNIRLERAEAGALPFAGSSFDIVTTRRAPHHFEDIPKFLSETTRVLKPNGRLGIVDMSPVEGTEEFINMIEKIRDPTHQTALTATEWRIDIVASGLAIVHAETLDERVTFERWLYPVGAGGSEEDAITKAWNDASREVKLALNVEEKAGRVEAWTKRRILVIAKKTA